MTKYWVSCRIFTGTVEVDAEGIITDGCPIVRKFRGQPFSNLLRWCKPDKIEPLYDLIEKRKREKNHTQNTVKIGVLGRVVHCKRESYDVYIGRGRCPRTGHVSDWGNPFTIGKDGDREEVIKKYEEWIRKQPQLLKQLHTLRGKVLACWCAPRACHGDVLLKLIEEAEGHD